MPKGASTYIERVEAFESWFHTSFSSNSIQYLNILADRNYILCISPSINFSFSPLHSITLQFPPIVTHLYNDPAMLHFLVISYSTIRTSVSFTATCIACSRLCAYVLLQRHRTFRPHKSLAQNMTEAFPGIFCDHKAHVRSCTRFCKGRLAIFQSHRS